MRIEGNFEILTMNFSFRINNRREFKRSCATSISCTRDWVFWKHLALLEVIRESRFLFQGAHYTSPLHYSFQNIIYLINLSFFEYPIPFFERILERGVTNGNSLQCGYICIYPRNVFYNWSVIFPSDKKLKWSRFVTVFRFFLSLFLSVVRLSVPSENKIIRYCRDR